MMKRLACLALLFGVLSSVPMLTGRAAVSLDREFLAFGFRQDGDPTLRNSFNDALLSMRGDGMLTALRSKYIPQPDAGELEPVEFGAFRGGDSVKVAVEDALSAFDGVPADFNAAVLAEIGRRLHVNIELVDIGTMRPEEALRSGNVDVIVQNIDRRVNVPEGLALSESYLAWARVSCGGLSKQRL